MSVDPTDPALVAAVDEAVDTAVNTIDWDGVAVTVPASLDDIDPDAIEAGENGKMINALRSILGSEEYDRARNEWAKAHGRRPKIREVNRLADIWAEHVGLENAGE